jgi:hypothetical protein
MVQAVTCHRKVKRALSKWKRLRVPQRESQIPDSVGGCGPPRALKYCGRQIDSANPSNMPREPERQRPRTAGKIHRTIAGVCPNETREQLGFACPLSHGKITKDFRRACEAVAYKVLLSLVIHSRYPLSNSLDENTPR